MTWSKYQATSKEKVHKNDKRAEGNFREGLDAQTRKGVFKGMAVAFAGLGEITQPACDGEGG